MWITHAIDFASPSPGGTFQWQNARVAEQNQRGLRSLQIQLLRRQYTTSYCYYGSEKIPTFGRNSLANHEVS